MLKRSCLAAALWLATLAGSASAQTTGYYFSYADLEKLFVRNQQYFILNDEGFNNPSFNHLHFTTIDTNTGAFTGTLWAPVLQPAAPQAVVPVTGTLTIHDGVSSIGFSSGSGNYYEIAFTWIMNGTCQGSEASYKGAISFRGYQGSKMTGLIGGTLTSIYSSCGIGILPYSPQPFSGTLTQ